METLYVPLHHKGKVVAHALIDAVSAPSILPLRWTLLEGYAVHRWRHRPSRTQGTIFMHRLLLGLPERCCGGPEGDHINHERLDNRLSNLRIATKSEQQQNRRESGYRGVHWYSDRKAYRAAVWIRHNGKRVRVTAGWFTDEEEAALVVSRLRASLMPFSPDALRSEVTR